MLIFLLLITSSYFINFFLFLSHFLSRFILSLTAVASAPPNCFSRIHFTLASPHFSFLFSFLFPRILLLLRKSVYELLAVFSVSAKRAKLWKKIFLMGVCVCIFLFFSFYLFNISFSWQCNFTLALALSYTNVIFSFFCVECQESKIGTQWHLLELSSGCINYSAEKFFSLNLYICLIIIVYAHNKLSSLCVESFFFANFMLITINNFPSPKKKFVEKKVWSKLHISDHPKIFFSH